MPRRSDTSDLTCCLDANPVLDRDNVYFSDQGWAYRHFKNAARTEYWDEILVAGQALLDDGNPDTTADIFGTASPTFLVGDGTQPPANSVVATGGIFGSGAFTTTTPFTETDGSTVAVTFSAPTGGGVTAVGTAVTSGGNMIGYGLSDIGDGYEVGETVTVTEDGGAGVATFEVTSVA